jgi:hypothetical protein
VDEKKLAELFQEAVRDTPPASFGTGDVRQASHRATIRRRNGIVAGSALVLALLAGGAVTTVALTGGKSNSTASAPAAAGRADTANSGTMDSNGLAPRVEQAPSAPSAKNDRSEPPMQGGPLTGQAGTSAGGGAPSGCGQADRELVAALADELPAAAKPSEPLVVPFGCPPGSRGGAVRVTQGAKSGVISIFLIPPGVSPGFAAPGSNVSNSAISSAGTATGSLLYVVSQPAPGTTEPPFGDDTSAISVKLAKDF